MAEYTILGVHITNRVTNAPEVQKVLTKFGCSIKTRLGLHQVENNNCTSFGLLLLEMIGPETEIQKLENALAAITGVEVKKMVF